MKKIFLKTIAVAVLAAGLTGCANDLNISSIDRSLHRRPILRACWLNATPLSDLPVRKV